jgi:hypothetical protein
MSPFKEGNIVIQRSTQKQGKVVNKGGTDNSVMVEFYNNFNPKQSIKKKVLKSSLSKKK